MSSILIIATFFAAFDQQLRRINIVSIYLLSIVIIGRITDGYFWSCLSSFISLLCVNYFFTYPYFAFNFTRAGYPITFAIMIATSLLVNLTTTQLKINSKIAEKQKQTAEVLYSIMQDLVSTDSKEEAIETMTSHLRQHLNTTVEFHENEEANQKEGLKDHWYFKPLSTPTQYYGTLVVDLTNIDIPITEFEHFLDLIVSRTSMLLEHLTLKEIQQQTLFESEKEKMRSNLLRAISHDLRTPLTTMLGSTSTLLDNGSRIDAKTSKELLLGMQKECEWLIHMVENLLSVTRICEGETRLTTTLEPAEEILASAVMKLKKRCPETDFRVTIPDELLLVPMDATLIEQVIINLCENSVYHSGSPSPIDLILERDKNFAVFTIRDYGRGLSPSQIEHLFDGYTSYSLDSKDTYKGMGIGLSICMTIIKAHNGMIQGYNNTNNEQKGASFAFSLPMEENNYE